MEAGITLEQRGDSKAGHWAINTTVRCQHRCIYCFEGERRGMANVPADQSKKVIEEAAQHVPAVIFMGAEPTLNPSLVELVRFARSCGLGAGISTNALRLADRGYLDELFEAGLGTIELSFPYPDAAVYGAITGAKRDGFERLLQALANIDQVNREHRVDAPPPYPPQPLEVNVNVVVSALNGGRLAEVLAHVRSRLEVTRYCVTLKRIRLSYEPLPADLVERCRLTVQELRGILPEVLARSTAGAEVGVRGFPLCAVPGWEHRDLDLAYWLGEAEVAGNFAEQDQMRSMYPSDKLRTGHRYEWLCAACVLEPICLQRELFDEVEPRRQDAPVPLDGSWPLALRALAERFERGRQLLAGPPPTERSASAILLRELCRQAPPGSLLDGTDTRIYPGTTGTLSLENADGSAEVRIGAPNRACRTFWPAGDLVVAPAAGIESCREVAGPLVRLLLGLQLPQLEWQERAAWWDTGWRQLSRVVADQWLRTPEVPPPHCEVRPVGGELQGMSLTVPLTPGPLADGAEFSVTRSSRCPNRPIVLLSSAVVRSDAASLRLQGWLEALRGFADPWQDLVGDEWAARVVETLASADGSTARPDQEGVSRHSGTLLVRQGTGGLLLPCFVLPLTESLLPGFLCDGLLMWPHHELLRTPVGIRLVRTIGRALRQVQEEHPATAEGASRSPFLRAVWQRLGPDLLWPQATSDATCVEGRVALDKVAMRFVCESGQELRLTVGPSRPADSVEEGGSPPALRCRWFSEAPPDRCGRAVVEAYARAAAAPGATGMSSSQPKASA